MLKIIVNSTELDLGNVKGISFKESGNIFNYTSFEGGFSFPFSLPFSEINNGVMKNFERINKTGIYDDIE